MVPGFWESSAFFSTFENFVEKKVVDSVTSKRTGLGQVYHDFRHKKDGKGRELHTEDTKTKFQNSIKRVASLTDSTDPSHPRFVAPSLFSLDHKLIVCTPHAGMQF